MKEQTFEKFKRELSTHAVKMEKRHGLVFWLLLGSTSIRLEVLYKVGANKAIYDKLTKSEKIYRVKR